MIEMAQPLVYNNNFIVDKDHVKNRGLKDTNYLEDLETTEFWFAKGEEELSRVSSKLKTSSSLNVEKLSFSNKINILIIQIR